MAAPTVEILLNAVWTDITQYVRVADGITITRGRVDESTGPQVASCSMKLTNDGRFSPRNTGSPYYPYLTRNTQIRVTKSGSVRFNGFVSEWPQDWDPSEKNRWVSITANGPRRRLARGNVLNSALRRAVKFLPSTRPAIAYWPCEDPSTATSFSYLGTTANGSAGTFTGSGVQLAASSRVVGSAALPLMGDLSTFRFPVPYNTPASNTDFGWVMNATVPSGAASLAVQAYTSGTFIWEVDYAPTADTYNLLWINASTGVTTGSSGAIVGGFGQGTSTQVVLQLKQNGANIDYALIIYSASNTVGSTVTSGSVAGSTLGRYTTLWFFNGTGMTTALGHVYVQNTAGGPDSFGAAVGGNAGETALARVSRLCTEEGVGVTLNPGTSAGELVGIQGQDTFINLVDAAMAADLGLSTEQVDDAKLYFRSRTSQYSQAAAFTLSYANTQDINPADDDALTVNDVTVTRDGGSTARSTVTTGNVGSTTAGVYAQSYTLSLYRDDQAQGQADWRVSEGTIDQARLPSILTDAVNNVPGGSLASLLALREGDTIAITNLPAFTGLASTVRMLVMGWTETITHATWMFNISAQPSLNTNVLIWDDTTYGVLDSVNVWGY